MNRTFLEDLEQRALAYAKRAPIFPVLGKAPHGKYAPNGFKSATADAAIVASWFANGAPPTGVALEPSVAGLIVLDVDERNGGFDSLASLEQRYGKLPDTAACVTPGGGEHRYLKPPEGTVIASRNNAFGDEFPGIDVKASGGYVLLPGSQHPNGGVYRWDAEGAPIATAPLTWIAALLAAQRSEASAPITGVDNDARIISGNRRNKTLLRYAGRLRHHGTGAAAIEDALLAVNRRQCDPPMPEDEVSALARDVAARYEPAAPLPHGLDHYNARNGRATSGEPARRELRVVNALDVPMTRPEWLEPGRIAFGMLTLFDGMGDIGKTTMALTIIASATVGRTLFDDTRRDPMTAVIIAEEDELGWLRAKLAVAGADLSRIEFVDASTLGDEVGSVRFPRDVPALRVLIERFGAPIVYIDALFSHLELDGEGKMPQQMRAAIAPIARLARESGVAAIATRHWGKGTKSAAERGLGSIELSNVARSVLSFGLHPDSQSDAPRFVLATTKSNLARKSPSIEYQLQSVEVLDDNGSPWSVPQIILRGIATGITADDLAMGAPQNAEERDRLSEAQDVIVEALAEAPLTAAELAKSVRGHQIADVTFRRARAKLRENGRIQREGGGVAGPVRWSLAESHSRSLESIESHSDREREWTSMSESEGAEPDDEARI